MEAGREGGKERGRDRSRVIEERGREGERERGREGERERGREGERERRREGGTGATHVDFRRILQEGGTSNKNMVF